MGSSWSHSSQSTQMVPGMMGVYSDLLNRNQANYNNVLAGYQTGRQDIARSANRIDQGYGKLLGDVGQTLGQGGGWGIATPAAEAIQRNYQSGLGRNFQNLISSGLGNSTVLSNLNRATSRDMASGYANLGSQLASRYASAQEQLGGARLEGWGRMQGLSTGLTNSYLGHLAGYQFRNTAGDLTGHYGHSAGGSVDGGGGGGGGGHGAGGGGTLSGLPWDGGANFNSGGWLGQDTGYTGYGSYMPQQQGPGNSGQEIPLGGGYPPNSRDPGVPDEGNPSSSSGYFSGY